MRVQNEESKKHQFKYKKKNLKKLQEEKVSALEIQHLYYVEKV